jgi:predicted RNase H-like HicB family nuclease
MERKKRSEPAQGSDVRFYIDVEREEDGRWIAEIADIPGVLAYGETEEPASAYALALRVIADQVEESKSVPKSVSVRSASA